MDTKVRRIAVNVVHTSASGIGPFETPESELRTPEEAAKEAAQYVYDQIRGIDPSRVCSLVLGVKPDEEPDGR